VSGAPGLSSRGPTLPVAWDARYEADLGPSHRMPIRKFRLVRDAIVASGLPVRITPPAPATDTELLRVHTRAYVRAVDTGEPRALAESQKMPWSPGLARSVRYTTGGCIAAARAALDAGVAGNLASGFHHAHADHGEGFCTFNGLLVALEALRVERPGVRALIVDLDLHYGNGSASLLRSRPWAHQLSVYGNDYADNVPYRDVSVVRHADTDNARSVAVPAGTDGAGYLERIAAALGPAIDRARPDLILYQAGADPYREDPYSPLDLGLADLAARDALVLDACRARGIPVAWVLAGGYTEDVSRVVEVHLGTVRASVRALGEGEP
jgi:acetoin utilization deacetylase AcuC-like enzyme